MRQFAMIMIFGAFLLQGCDRNRGSQVTTQTSSTTTETYQPQAEAQVPVPVVTPTPVKEKSYRSSKAKAPVAPVDDQVSSAQAAPVTETRYRDEAEIQAQEVWPKDKDKTYNELQISDDVNDYPLTPQRYSIDHKNYK